MPVHQSPQPTHITQGLCVIYCLVEYTYYLYNHVFSQHFVVDGHRSTPTLLFWCYVQRDEQVTVFPIDNNHQQSNSTPKSAQVTASIATDTPSILRTGIWLTL